MSTIEIREESLDKLGEQLAAERAESARLRSALAEAEREQDDVRAQLAVERVNAGNERANLYRRAEAAERKAEERFDCRRGPGWNSEEPACGSCVTCLTRALDGMTGERDSEREIAQGWERKYEDAEIALREAKEALAPLAAVAAMAGDESDHVAFVHWAGCYRLTWGDARRARALSGGERGEADAWVIEDTRNPIGNHAAWFWGPNRSGYTNDITKPGGTRARKPRSRRGAAAPTARTASPTCSRWPDRP